MTGFCYNKGNVICRVHGNVGARRSRYEGHFVRSGFRVILSLGWFVVTG